MVAVPKWLKNSQWEGQQPSQRQRGLCLREIPTHGGAVPACFIASFATWRCNVA